METQIRVLTGHRLDVGRNEISLVTMVIAAMFIGETLFKTDFETVGPLPSCADFLSNFF